MTYLEFHLYFNLPLLLLLWSFAWRRVHRAHVRTLAGVLAIVVAFTWPWDSHAVAEGIWGFPPERVALWIGNLPAEEILFFVIESLAVVALVLLFLPRPTEGGPRGRGRDLRGEEVGG